MPTVIILKGNLEEVSALFSQFLDANGDQVQPIIPDRAAGPVASQQNRDDEQHRAVGPEAPQERDEREEGENEKGRGRKDEEDEALIPWQTAGPQVPQPERGEEEEEGHERNRGGREDEKGGQRQLRFGGSCHTQPGDMCHRDGSERGKDGTLKDKGPTDHRGGEEEEGRGLQSIKKSSSE